MPGQIGRINIINPVPEGKLKSNLVSLAPLNSSIHACLLSQHLRRGDRRTVINAKALLSQNNTKLLGEVGRVKFSIHKN